MKPVTVYSTNMCPFCDAAKALLSKRGVPYEEITFARSPDSRDHLIEKTGGLTFPQILIGETNIGGFQELRAADQSGKLGELLAA